MLLARVTFVTFIIFISNYVGSGPQLIGATCVLASDFGFTLNCAFRKSGLFRVRNLGGVKAHVGLGFTVGDELGLAESLSNLEGNKRRSTDVRSQMGANQLIVQDQTQRKFASTSNQTTLADLVNEYQRPARMHNKPNQTSDVIMRILAQNVDATATQIPPFKPIPPQTDAKQLIASVLAEQIRNASDDKSLRDKHAPVYRDNEIDTGTNASGFVMSGARSGVTNVSSAAADIIARQKLLRKKTAADTGAQKFDVDVLTAALTRGTSTNLPVETHRQSSPHKDTTPKVMNAPKEYYPVGYDKNFDDNFASRVELPETSFYCGQQKHFPGLYADEDLGCMVFHVCALTDDGLVMKSFLCPESTLFDQTILKCNWWFYVDCKNSKSLYDSNIPVSKSYQLMKALTFFSTIKKDSQKTEKDVVTRN